MAGIEQLFAEGLAELRVASTPQQREKLLSFLALLEKWNRVYNLTSVANAADQVPLHLLDSLAVLPFLKGTRVLDVGTGAGLPGIPLAVFRPELEFVLLDGNSKKTRFVQQAVIELGLSNVRVVHARIEGFESAEGFDVILSRAFASLSAFLRATRHLARRGGVLLAQKGRFPGDEMGQLREVRTKVFPLEIPGLGAERHLIEMTIPD